jgi:predicted dehydrogenase
MTVREDPDYKPSFPEKYRPGIGIVGCGAIVRSSHLPSYARYGQRVVGVYDVRPEATVDVRETHSVEVFDDLAELLGDPEVEIVDIATHPDVRPALIREALAAGKHVLAQKPLAEDLDTAREIVEEAERLGLRLAVNQNGRWAPAWRAATLLVEQGAVGDVVAVTHLYDHNYGFTLGTVFDGIEHLVLYDYSIHWFDITRCWLEAKRATSVRAREYRTPNQPPESTPPWGAWATIEYEDGSSAFIRGIGGAATTRPSKPFWIHGTEGTIRGHVLGSGNVPGSELMELERNGARTRFELDGTWHSQGFAGTLSELVCAIAEGREPYDSARHNLLSLELTLAACRSADEDGEPVAIGIAASVSERSP